MRVADELDRLVRQRDRPGVADLLARVEEDISERHVGPAAVMEALGGGDDGLVEQVDRRLAGPGGELGVGQVPGGRLSSPSTRRSRAPNCQFGSK